MAKKAGFKGSLTALVTPFKNGKLDEDGFRKLVEWQIAEGSHGLVPVGTTGESPTLTHQEHHQVVEICIDQAKGRVPVVAGAGSNNTREAVDLAGHTQDARTGVFALRVAPVQAAWLGYPGTMGADFIDYLIADKTVIPDDGLSGYSEKIVRLPYSYLVSDTARPISGKVFTRQEMGLPEEGFVFCCFNNASLLSKMAEFRRVVVYVKSGSRRIFQDHGPVCCPRSSEGQCGLRMLIGFRWRCKRMIQPMHQIAMRE